MPDADDLIGQLREPFFIHLRWLDDDDDWEVSTNCDNEELAAGLSHMLFRMAIGDTEFKEIQ